MTHITDDLKLLLSEEQVADTVHRVAGEVRRDYQNGPPVFIGILKGAFMFLADLVRAFGLPAELDFVRMATYGSSDAPEKEPVVTQDIILDITGRDVVLVEDIVDTGSSLAYLVDHFSARSPRSLKIAALIDRRGRRRCDVKLDYVGVSLESGFIVGYGMDFAERYRNLPAIYELQSQDD
jgi:hypoxanthine phosphoribosyltransferase